MKLLRPPRPNRIPQPPSLSGVRRILVILAWTGIAVCLWRLTYVLPLRTAEPEMVEAARSRIATVDSTLQQLLHAALDRTRVSLRYDSTYVPIPYPNGDIPANTGVCSDEVIRCYRAIGIDLQQMVHEDMIASFPDYPKLWNLSQPDPNIDHWRVPNLETFLTRQGARLTASQNPADYQPGDLITSRITGGRPHIAIVVPAPDGKSPPWILHNRGFGPAMEDQLLAYPITGHFRWWPCLK